MKEKKKNNKKNILYKVLSMISLLISIGYLLYSILKVNSIITNLETLSIPIFTFIISLILFITVIKTKELLKIYVILSSILIVFMAFNVASASKIIRLPEDEKLVSYVNVSYEKFSKWAEKNKIKVITEYEYDDKITEGYIIRLSVAEGTYTKDIKEITVTISDGPNYDKLIIIPSMIGWNIDDTVKYIKDNFITNVEINFEVSSSEKDTILEQSKNGEIRRNEGLILKASLGEDSIEEIDLIKLTNMDIFDATLWLKRNNIKYSISYEFSNDIKRNIVLNQSIKENTTINTNNDEVILTISKGKAIKVPDLTKMTVEEITKWITENKLKISFNEVYDEKIETGKVISQSVLANDEVEEGTLITITISRGQIKMEEFSSLLDFKNWANKYNVKYNENYEYSNTVSKGNVISYSYNTGDIIDPDGVIYVKVSLGKAISIPSFIGKSKADAQSTCNSLGIRCSFVSGTYTTYAANIVYSQSRNVGNKVSSGSTITLTLSKGTPKEWNLAIGAWELQDNADGTIKSLTSAFANRYPGVNFKFQKVKDNTLRNGLVALNSPTTKGSLVKQGETYTLYIIAN